MVDKIIEKIKCEKTGEVYTIRDATAAESISQKQDILVSGENIKTINNESILGDGNLEIVQSGIDVPDATESNVNATYLYTGETGNGFIENHVYKNVNEPDTIEIYEFYFESDYLTLEEPSAFINILKMADPNRYERFTYCDIRYVEEGSEGQPEYIFSLESEIIIPATDITNYGFVVNETPFDSATGYVNFSITKAFRGWKDITNDIEIATSLWAKEDIPVEQWRKIYLYLGEDDYERHIWYGQTYQIDGTKGGEIYDMWADTPCSISAENLLAYIASLFPEMETDPIAFNAIYYNFGDDDNGWNITVQDLQYNDYYATDSYDNFVAAGWTVPSQENLWDNFQISVYLSTKELYYNNINRVQVQEPLEGDGTPLNPLTVNRAYYVRRNGFLPNPTSEYLNDIIFVNGDTHIDPQDKRTQFKYCIHHCDQYPAYITALTIPEQNVLGNLTPDTVTNLLKITIPENEYFEVMRYLYKIKISYHNSQQKWYCSALYNNGSQYKDQTFDEDDFLDTGITIIGDKTTFEEGILITPTMASFGWKWYRAELIPQATIKLKAANWDGSNNQTITVSKVGLTKDSKIYITPETDSAREYIDCGIACVGKDTNSLTFNCNNIPQNNLKVNVMVS